MYRGPEYSHHSQVVTGQLSTEAVEHIFGVGREDVTGQLVLDLGSGFRQQLAQDWEAAGATVISVDPNQPYSNQYLLKQVVNRIQTDSMMLETMAGLPASGLFLSGELGEEFLGNAAAFWKEKGVKLAQKDGPMRTGQIVEYYRYREGIPGETYGKVVAASALNLPFPDGMFDRIIASSSVPYGLPYASIPRMLAEANRVLKPRGEARFNPVAVGDFSNFVDLATIRALIKTARAEARRTVKGGLEDDATQEQKIVFEDASRTSRWLDKFSLSMFRNEEYVRQMAGLSNISHHAQAHQANVLVLTNKS